MWRCYWLSGWEKELSEIPVRQLHKYPMTEFLLVCLIHVVLEVLSTENKSIAAASVIPLAQEVSEAGAVRNMFQVCFSLRSSWNTWANTSEHGDTLWFQFKMRYHSVKRLIQRHPEIVGLKTAALKLDEQSVAEFSEHCIQTKYQEISVYGTFQEHVRRADAVWKEDIFFDLAAGDCGCSSDEEAWGRSIRNIMWCHLLGTLFAKTLEEHSHAQTFNSIQS